MYERTICVMGRCIDSEDGIMVYAYNLLRAMAALDTRSRYVILLRTPKHVRSFDGLPNVEIQVLPARVKTVWDQVVVPLAARRVQADLIFNPKFSLPLLTRRPGVFVLHGSDWYVNPQNYKWWDNTYIRWMMPLYCYKASHLLAISHSVVDDLVRHARIDAKKVTVTYAAPSSHFSQVTDKTSLREFALRHGLPERFMLTVARVYHTGYGHLPEYPGGNNETLVGGYRRYRANGGNLPFVVVGKDIEKYLRNRGFRDDDLEGIQFTGFIPHSEINKIYSLAEFFILATLSESFCLPLVEAMASGCPAIVPSTGACPEIAGGAARLVDPCDAGAIGNAMVEFANSVQVREQMRAAGLERVRMFTWERTAQLTLNALAGVLRKSRVMAERPPRNVTPSWKDSQAIERPVDRAQ